MDKKLTLSLNKAIIEQAKLYAKANNVSLSRLIEFYLASLVKEENKAGEITSLVSSLSGVVTLPSEFNEKEDYISHLLDKHK